MEIRNRLTVTRGEGVWISMETRGRTSQGTGINDPWTWTTGCGSIVGYAGQGRPMGKNWDDCNRTTIKKYKKTQCFFQMSSCDILVGCEYYITNNFTMLMFWSLFYVL